MSATGQPLPNLSVPSRSYSQLFLVYQLSWSLAFFFENADSMAKVF